MTIKFVVVSEGILYDPDLRPGEKLLVAMAQSFSSGGGLRLSNNRLGKILGINESNVSKLISKLARRGWIMTTGKGRERKIFCAQTGSPGDSGRAERIGTAERPGRQADAEKRTPTDTELAEMMKQLGL